MPREIEGNDPVRLGQWADVVGVGLQMATDPRHEDEGRGFNRSRLEDPCTPRPDLLIRDRVGHRAEGHPDRHFDNRAHRFPPGIRRLLGVGVVAC